MNSIEIVPRVDAEAATTAIGGANSFSVLERARQIELSIYNVSSALIAPDIISLDADAVAAYRPFDVIQAFRVSDGGESAELRPLVIFDDAHNLHPTQLSALQRWLARRELRVARWILMRLDALKPKEILADGNYTTGAETEPGLKPAREITYIRLQSGDDRGNQRRAFRKMAKDMANRYLSQMDVFSRRMLKDLSDLLLTESEKVTAGQLKTLEENTNKIQKRHGIIQERRARFEAKIDRYVQSSMGEDNSEDVKASMLNILMERYAKRIPQRSLFENQGDDPDPSRPLTADGGIADGARIHLLHKFNRPYYFGIDSICDASSENAEQFLQLASRLVSRSETQLVRAKPPSLSSSVQNKLIREQQPRWFNSGISRNVFM